MATCGRCQREITWAWDEEQHSLVAVDKLAGLAMTAPATAYKLDFETPDQRPIASRVRRPDVWPGHRLHSETCGVGTIR